MTKKELHKIAEKYAEMICEFKYDEEVIAKWELESLLEDAFEDGYEQCLKDKKD